MKFGIVSSLGAALLLATQVRAGIVSGRVINTQGQGLAGVNLDFEPTSGGGNPTVLNDGTDANGFFNTTVTPSGTYRVTFLPPAPPASTALAQDLDNVVVTTGTTNLGNVTLASGVALTGRCVDSVGAGIAGVNLDVLDAGGNNLTLTNDMSDALGFFSIAVPMGPIEVRFDTTPVAGPLLAPKALSLDLSNAYDTGNVVLPAGFVMSATVRRLSNNVAVADVDVDVVDSLSGVTLYTPGDNTDAAGFVDVVVAAGTYDVRFEAPFALHLVGQELDSVVVAAPVSLGTILLENGFVLSGTVQGFDATLHGGVDVDVKYASTGVGVFLGNDNTNTSGFYQVIAPAGTFNVTFSPPLAIPYGGVTYSNVVVSANTLRNGTLPSCPFFSTVGTGIAGLGGITPQISSSGGTPRINNPAYRIHCAQARGGATSIIIYSLLPTPGTLPNPCQIVPPMQRRVVVMSGPYGVAGVGAGSFAFPLANDPLLVGQLIRAWYRVRDAAATGGFSFTNELRTTICP